MKLKILACSLALTGYGTCVMGETLALEEVVVTAQKREQSLQEVPVAVTALTTETMEAMDIASTADLTRASASLSHGQGPTPNSNVFRVRGIGTGVVSVGIESGVSVVVDEVPQMQPGQSLSNLVDIERIEILRGPQTTLFGKNASAGLINIVTKSPTEEFESFIETTLTDDNELKISGVVSGPLTQTLGYRVAAYSRDYDGWAENLFTGASINGAEERGVRGKLAWQPSNTLDVLIVSHYYQSKDNCCAMAYRELDPAARLFGFAPVTITNPRTLIAQSDNNTDPEIDLEPSSEADDYGTSLKVSWTIGDVELTSISSYNNWQNETRSDLDFSPLPILSFAPSLPISGGVVSNSRIDNDFFTQELRLSSSSADRFDYLVGLYYGNSDTDQYAARNFTPTNYVARVGNKTKAVFGELSWRLREDTHLILGSRYNHEKITVDFANRVANQRYNAGDSEGRWLGKLALQHFIDDDTMFFASAATGFKGQGYDISPSFDQRTADNPVRSEDSRSFEVGLKSSLFNRRLQLSVVGFYTEYDDYQAQNSEVIDQELVLAASNVGDLETKGVEVDANFLVGRGLIFNSSIAWIDAVIADYPNASCFPNQTVAQGCTPAAPGAFRTVQDLSGKPLNNTPDWKLTLGAQYFRPFESTPYDGFVNVSYRWQDDVTFDLKQNPGSVQQSYGTMNVSAGIRERSLGKYQISLFINNLFDQDYAAAIIDQSGLYAGKTAYAQLVPRNARRYAGLRMKYLF